MDKTYNPEFEKRIYEFWMKNKYFEAHPNPDKEPFTIMMPPPNITGQLHIGHALNNTLQDIIIRFKRMSGFEALWLPGTDHASIATEAKIVEKMKAEGLTKNNLGREGFLERAWAWKKRYGGRIVEQFKRLGTSCDWSKEAFTMDENLSSAVLEVFVKLYEKGLIYRGDRIINWCPSCRTAISDAEVEYEEQDSHLWYFDYPFADGEGFMTIATTRPETMLGDTAVAVNPKDKKYADAVGRMLKLPLTGREIPVVADDYVEIGFGTGAVKITPAHDPNDFEVGLRHNLPTLRVMDDGGVMNENAGARYQGLDRFEARKLIVKDMEAAGLLRKIEPYRHNVGGCYRCGVTVEPIVSKQWFVKMKPLAEGAIAAVKSGEIRFIPKRFEKVYFNWMENVKDWCISRQLWWGHRIPAYYCSNCGETVVAKERPAVCPRCGHTEFKQDEDVLDTWFSSALWPFSTLGFPKETPELKYFYPTNVLVTAYEIIFFWVARMIFSGLWNMGEVPFSEVLIHGIVRDEQGRKMSKSLGNGVDPIEIIDRYGADALRFSLSIGTALGSDMRFVPAKIENARNFLNKLWNASRFVIMNLNGAPIEIPAKLTPADKWILTKLNRVIKDVTNHLNRYDIGLASAKLYDFVWNEFCDWYIEAQKPALYGDNAKAKESASSMLAFVLSEILKLTHPFAPFITEEIYGILTEGKPLIVAEWPKHEKNRVYFKEARLFEGLKEIIVGIRNVRSETGVPTGKKIKAYIIAHREPAYLKKTATYLEKLANLSGVEFTDSRDVAGKSVSVVTPLAEVLIPMGDLVDMEKELARLQKEKEAAQAEINKGESMLQNTNFLLKAPAKLIEAEKEKLEKSKEKLSKLLERIASLA
ncbi:MAG TPA: valine--tRNA ligase [Eubacteriales bacterium]|jgi:valyl-tRNA synthetase|nr:valine--tRNA ligase [Eubacteriales bacterium]